MISLEIIEHDIAELESRDTSFAICEKLAILYTVRDHLKKYDPAAGNPVESSGSSDLMQAVKGKNADEVWKIMDRFADAVKTIHPKMYNNLISKISKL